MTETRPLTAERIVKAHTKIKAMRDAYVQQTNTVIDGFDAKLDLLENRLLQMLNDQGQDSFRVAGKTVYRHKDVKPSGADWSKIYAWIAENAAWDMLERRITKTFIVDYMAKHHGGIPPGVNVLTKFTAKIRSLPKKKETLPDD